MDRQLKIILMFLMIVGAVKIASGQSVLKVGDNGYQINNNAVLEVESTTQGFLLPRMTIAQRDAIASPPLGLQIWCTDSNVATNPASAELCVYLDSGWTPVALLRNSKLSTGKKSDVNSPVLESATSATIKGTLVSTFGIAPTETGVVWKEITGNDFGIFPSLDENAVATAPVYKTVGTLVDKPGGVISVTIPSLISTTSGTRPYYFRTYAKSASGIGYGNPVVFNCAPLIVNPPVWSGGTITSPTFAGTLTVNAGTPQGMITEYGYCTATNNSPTTADNKVVLSTAASLATLNAALNSEIFTADPTADLAVTNYNSGSSSNYIRYYVIANAAIVYSAAILSSPAVVSDYNCAKVSLGNLKEGIDASGLTQIITATVSTAGTYSISATANGVTFSGSGIFLTTGAQDILLTATGVPETTGISSFVLDTTPSCSFSRTTVAAASAICDGSDPTVVVPILSLTGRTWMDRNLGAARKATAVDDYLAYGCLYQWGRGNDGHASIIWTSGSSGSAVNGATTTLSTSDVPGHSLIVETDTYPGDWRSPQNDLLWQGVTGTNNPCPAQYRLPTNVEFAFEVEKYPILDTASGFNSPHKFAYAGFQLGGSEVYDTGGSGNYWGSTTFDVNGSDWSISQYGVSASYYQRQASFSVRCIKD